MRVDYLCSLRVFLLVGALSLSGCSKKAYIEFAEGDGSDSGVAFYSTGNFIAGYDVYVEYTGQHGSAASPVRIYCTLDRPSDVFDYIEGATTVGQDIVVRFYEGADSCGKSPDGLKVGPLRLRVQPSERPNRNI